MTDRLSYEEKEYRRNILLQHLRDFPNTSYNNIKDMKGVLFSALILHYDQNINKARRAAGVPVIKKEISKKERKLRRENFLQYLIENPDIKREELVAGWGPNVYSLEKDFDNSIIVARRAAGVPEGVDKKKGLPDKVWDARLVDFDEWLIDNPDARYEDLSKPHRRVVNDLYGSLNNAKISLKLPIRRQGSREKYKLNS